ncbi:PBPb domain-containing protein, partial [Haematococcus lacustris]
MDKTAQQPVVGGGLLLTAADMKGTTVCFQAGDEATFSNAFPGLGVQKVLLPSLKSCYDQLRQGKVDSVFGVREQHVAHLNTVKEDAWYVTPIVIQQAYALAWLERWPYASVVNSALLTWKEGSATAVPSYSDSVNKFLAGRPVDIMFSDPETATAGQPKWRWGLLASTIALVALYMALQVRLWALCVSCATTHLPAPWRRPPYTR